jgi:hypothetical protein
MVLVKKGGVREDPGTETAPTPPGHDPSGGPKEKQPEHSPGAAIPNQKEPAPKTESPPQAPKEGKARYECAMDGTVREGPGPCPKCGMTLSEKDRVREGTSPGGREKAVESRPAPGPEKGHVHEEKKPGVPQAQAEAMKPEPGTPAAPPQADGKKAGEFIYKCPMDGAVRETPGPCPKCGMTLDERYKVPKPRSERTIYVCDLHPEEVYEKPGQCFKESCAGMALEPRKIVPGAKLIYVCPAHPEVKQDKPGVCPKEKCGKKLGYKIVSETTQLSEVWACPLHPQLTAGGKFQCPECGCEMRHLEVEQMLAVPFSAVIDTGVRKVVYMDRGHGTFDAVEIEVGPRAGEYYPVLKGLAAGDRVVTAGAFLLDAETRLNPAAGVIYFGASGQGGDKK